ncbi:MFS transporter [Zophobihabitans entericus]|uniref:MFS transporter n=1 Tax=Zophobihabitans entericus TaxID=1635327 RepID=A0A6G9IB05_9GAMM|nr:MFS transporter [Zophobihabitans entericus]QIQ21415.1 MFS transporter [Zophobihabitans entericus]
MKSSLTYSSNKAYWSAIFSLFMGVTSLIAAEFIPVSLLTPIAQELNITEGIAGQTVTAVGIFAVIASLTLAPLTKTINRRYVLLTLSGLLVISNILVALAPNYVVLLIGRSILGICVGGFWSMASAVTLQLVPVKDVPKALSIVYAGVSVATIISLPLASYLGEVFGWREVFFLSALLSVVALIWQFFTLPSLPAQTSSTFQSMFVLIKQNWVLMGIGATVFSYGGYHIFFTYLRPFLEQHAVLQTSRLTIVLLIFGMANCVGTFVAGFILDKRFRSTLFAIHLILLLLAILLYFSNGNFAFEMILVIGWGFIFGFIPVGWSTWITRTLADKAEIVGGLSVAAIQFSIGFAAATGGLLFDRFGMNSIFICAAFILLLAVILIKFCFALFTKVTGTLA